MQLRYLTVACACALGAELAQAQSATAASALSEQDFLADVPVVLSVSRLAQRLDETPGAMTILDREFIRMTGARDVVDVLRFVPGFQTTHSFEEDAPIATYHGRYEAFANRIQVLVDGRSVYSGFLQGSAGLGWQTLSLDDIERIEVLRGSNSAAYGARAFLGVVNIVSRDVAETVGGSAKLTSGENGVNDVGARLGWGSDTSQYRISVDNRADSGLRKVFTDGKYAKGDAQVSRVNFASSHSLHPGSELDLRAGAVEVAAYRGEMGPDNYGSRERLRFLGSQFAQLDWRHTISQDEDVAVTLSRTAMFNRDGYPYLNPAAGYAPYYGITIESSGQEVNDVLGVQHTFRFNEQLRWVSGVEFRDELITSASTLDTIGSVSSHFRRIFFNAEWKPHAHVLVNAGGLAEASDIGGFNTAPRLMVNWQPQAGHVVRAGISTAFRTPSAFEKYSRVRYYALAGGSPTGYYAYGNADLKSETILSRELGYAWLLPNSPLAVDVRGFSESIGDGIGLDLNQPATSRNGDAYTIGGFELQLKWNNRRGSQVVLGYTSTNIDVHQLAVPTANTLRRVEYGAPKSASSLLWIQEMGKGLSAGISFQSADRYALTSDNAGLYSMVRSDLHLAQRWSAWGKKGELALTLQNLNTPFADGDKKFFFDKRAFVSMRLDY
ncbi:MAG: TonB-dependent receptor [Rhodoferax sp.]|nr:MAG: TonB-dependent receptor [Rhodoferax sp.]